MAGPNRVIPPLGPAQLRPHIVDVIADDPDLVDQIADRLDVPSAVAAALDTDPRIGEIETALSPIPSRLNAAEAAVERVDPGISGSNGQVIHYRGGAPMIGRLPFISAELDYGITPHAATDRSTAINTMIEEISAGGGGVIGFRGGQYRGHFVLRTGVTLSGMRGQYGYTGTSQPVRFQAIGGAWLIDTPSTAIYAAAVEGIDLRGDLVNGGGMRFQNTSWCALRKVSLHGFAEQGVLSTAGVKLTLDSVLATACLYRRGRTDNAGVIEIRSHDASLQNVEANTSQSGDLATISSANLYLNAFLVAGAQGSYVDCIGEQSDCGWFIIGQNNKFATCRGDYNYGHDWRVPGNRNVFAAVEAVEGGRAATNTYNGFLVSGFGNTFAGPSASTSTSQYKYLFEDTVQNSAAGVRNSWIAPNGTGYGTAFFKDSGFLGSAVMLPNNEIRPVSGTTSIDVNRAGRVNFTNYTTATTVTAFTGGNDGQVLYLFGDPDVTIAHNATIKTISGANLTLAAGRMYQFVNQQGVWYQVGG